jgi:hypothetical protein
VRIVFLEVRIHRVDDGDRTAFPIYSNVSQYTDDETKLKVFESKKYTPPLMRVTHDEIDIIMNYTIYMMNPT